MILLANIITILWLTMDALFFISGVLKFWRSVAMMQCQYLVSQNMDVNQRSTMQYDHLSSWLTLGPAASKQIGWSIIIAGVIIGLRFVFGAIYAYL